MKNVLLGVAGAGATREAITKRQIEALLVPVPPASAQGKFTAVVDEILQQRRRALGALDKQENLFASLQRAAFSGEI